MHRIWKRTTLVVLLLMGVMQALPFMQSHTDCQDACCQQTVSCCEQEASSGCEMAMTSCSVKLILPLVSAPLIKAESNVHLDMERHIPESDFPFMTREIRLNECFYLVLEATPPSYAPLLI